MSEVPSYTEGYHPLICDLGRSGEKVRASIFQIFLVLNRRGGFIIRL